MISFILSRHLALLVTVLVFITTLSSCQKEEKPSTIPFIAFKNLNKYRTGDPNSFAGRFDSVTLTIDYWDGNSDIGVDVTDPKSADNHLVNLYHKQNGVFVLLKSNPPYSGKLPKFPRKPGPYNFEERNPFLVVVRSAYEGEITRYFHFYHNLQSYQGIAKGDTLKFDIQIIDQEGNVSNRVESSEYIFWEE